MKKLVFSLTAFMVLSIAGLVAQPLSVTFKVDITDYINNGGAINQIVSIAGNFADRGSTTLPNWTPASGAMTDAGSNVWSIQVAFDGSATDSLNWKYVSGGDWGDGDEGNEWVSTAPDCKKPGSNNDRKLLLPASGSWVYSTKWAECGTFTVETANLSLIHGLDVKMGPNPTSSTLNIRFAGSAESVIRMTSLDGKVVKTIKTGQNGTTDHTVNVSDLNSGLYFVSVVDGGRTFKAPVVVTK